MRLTYSSDDLSPSQRVSLSVANVTVATALHTVLDNTGLQPVVMADGVVVLTRSARWHAGSDSSGSLAAEPTLTGRVVRGDGTPVNGATVGLLTSTDSVITSDSGRFVLHDIKPGSHLLWVRGVGFQPARVAVTVSPAGLTSVTVKLAPAIPMLSTVVTTAQLQSAYENVGFDRRMRAGVGQFLTGDQIEKRQAHKLSELLEGLRGIQVYGHLRQSDSFLGGTRGAGSCVSFVSDGIPQNSLYSKDAAGAELPPDDTDDLILPSAIGAIEVYGSAERPRDFGTPEAERLPARPDLTTAPGRPPTASADIIAPQQCVLVVIWTRTRLGTGGDTVRTAASRPPT